MTAPPPKTTTEAILAHSSQIRALALRLVGDPHLAEDLAQSTCLAAIERAPANVRNLKGWMAAVLRNLVAERARRERRREVHEPRAWAPPDPGTPDELVAELQIHRRVIDALATLEEPFRSVLVMRFVHDLPPREIAKRRGTPVTTVHSQVQRGLQRLRKRLEAKHGGRWGWCAPWIPALVRQAPVAATTGALLMKKLVLSTAAIVLLGALGGILVLFTSDDRGAQGADGASSAAPVAESAVRTPESEGTGERTLLAAEPEDRPGGMTVPRFEGLVVDPAGQPLADVELCWLDRGENEGDVPVTSDAGGAFAMAVPDVTRALGVTGDEFVTVLEARVGPGIVHESVPPVVVAAARIRLAGRVIDELGEPVAGVRVATRLPRDFQERLGLPLDASHYRQDERLSDEAGRFDLGSVGRIAGGRLVVEKTGFLTRELPQPEHSDHALVIELRRPEPSPGHLMGQVVDPLGMPVAGAHVALGRAQTRTDAGGTFVLPLEQAMGRRDVRAVKAGYLPARADLGAPAGDPAHEMPDFVVLRLEGRARTIAGRVVDAVGDPVAGAKVWPEGAGCFGMVGDTFASFEGMMAGFPTRAELRAEAEATGRDLSELWYGRPNQHWGWVQTDADGRFELPGLFDRDYELGVLLPELARIVRGPFRAGTNGIVLEVPSDVVLPRVGGVVLAPDGTPLSDVAVQAVVHPSTIAYRDDRADFIATVPQRSATVRTDADGRFAFERLGANVELRFEGDGILPGRYGESGTDLRTAGPRPVDDLRIEVSRRMRLRVELADSARADAFRVLTSDGEETLIHKLSGSIIGRVNELPIVDGRSAVCCVAEDVRTVVLLKSDEEVGRVPVQLVPGEVVIVRW